MSALSPAALDVLRAVTCAGHEAKLPDFTLERELYEEIAEVLSRLGGKWKRRGKAKDGVPQGVHVFPYDPSPLLAAVIETGEEPPKNPTAFFPTPAAVVAQMVKWCELPTFDSELCRILEPSAGTGAIADAIREHAPAAKLDLIEVLPINAAMLRRKGYEVHEGDFLQWKPGYQYDAVLMNPPFSLEGDPVAYLTHIEHAWSLLRDGGQLVAITPTGWTYRADRRSRDFIALVGEHGDSAEIEAGAFKESGTGIATRLVWMRKDNQRWKADPINGFPTWHTWAAGLWSDSEREFCVTRDRIYERIRSGALGLDLFGGPEEATRSEIVKHFEAVIVHANKSFEGIRPTESDYSYLVTHFLEEYAIWLEWETSRAPLKKSEAAA